MEKKPKVICPDCNGDGKETCHNPDHGFIYGMGGEIGRLGCPGCGHDPNHKTSSGVKCETCKGDGIVEEDIAIKFCNDMNYDIEFIATPPKRNEYGKEEANDNEGNRSTIA